MVHRGRHPCLCPSVGYGAQDQVLLRGEGYPAVRRRLRKGTGRTERQDRTDQEGAEIGVKYSYNFMECGYFPIIGWGFSLRNQKREP